jgi:signal transduction histidine kinase
LRGCVEQLATSEGKAPEAQVTDLRPYYLLAVALIAILFVAAIQVWRIYERTEAEAGRRTTEQAALAAVYVAQVFDAASLALASVDTGQNPTGLELRGSREEIHKLLRRAQLGSPVLRGIAMIGPDGRVFANKVSAYPQPTDLSTRPVFTFHRDSADTRVRIGRPIASPIPPYPVNLTLSMRVSALDGGFGGVVGARLDPAHFAAYFSKLGADAVSLVDADGVLYARYPEIDLLKAPRRQNRGLEAGNPVYLVSRQTGELRLSDVAAVPGTALSVLVSNPRSGIVATWLDRSAGTAFMTACAVLVLLLAGIGIRRRAEAQRRQQAALAAEEAATRREREHYAEIARRKSAFLAHMSHEIRTPLNAIIGFSDVIASDAMNLGGPARYRDYAADIRFSAGHLLGVVQHILDLSKIEAGKWVLSPGNVSMGDLMASVRQLAASRAEQEGVTLDLSGVDAGLSFVADERALVQMLLNLVINAVKFAGSDRTVRIGAARLADDGIVITVADRGPGMTPEDAQRAMRPFETSDDPKVCGKSETGLGLPLAKMFAELHGGTLVLDTAPGKGVCARVTLPGAAVTLAHAA